MIFLGNNNFKGGIYTEKRLIAVFAAICMIIGCLCLRLYTLSTDSPVTAMNSSHYKTVELAAVRGDILDCNGRRLTGTDYSNYLALKPTAKALNLLESVTDSDTFNSARQIMSKGNAVCVNIGKAEVDSISDAMCIKVWNRYSDKQLARHIIGYINGENKGVAGIEAAYENVLSTGKNLSVRFPCDAYGKVIGGARTELVNSTLPCGNVQLTVDSAIQRYVEDSLDMYDVAQGAAVVIEAKSGAVRAVASRPVYDARNLGEYIDREDSPFVNRALSAYAVGSIFKVCVAASALEKGITDFDYDCRSVCEVDGVNFHCNANKSHGKLDMRKALECSCNTYFIKLAQKIGAKAILETASSFGFGQQVKLDSEISAAQGKLPSLENLKLSGNLANFSFGQGDFTASAFQIAQMMAAVANSGSYLKPYIVERAEDSGGNVVFEHSTEYPVHAVSQETAEKLSDMLVSVVEKGNASKAKLINSVKAAGKTATAQTGSFDSNGNELCNTWFGGYFPADEPEYVIVILKQNGSSGAEDCAPVFKSIADKIIYNE